MVALWGFLIVLCLLDFNGFSQAIKPTADLQFIAQKSKVKSHFHKRDYIFKEDAAFLKKYNPVSLLFGSMLYIYQNAISQQLSANCLYHPSCSDFSKKSIRRYGFIKGVFLSADRLMRCNRIAGLDVEPLSIDPKTHRAHDPVDHYQFREHNH